MQLRKYTPLLLVLSLSLIAFLLHKAVLYGFFRDSENTFRHSLGFLYSLFCLFSLTIVLILIRVKTHNIDSVGQAFLLLTCIKMAAAYAVLYPILQAPAREAKIEKISFFVVFALFLAIETIVTIRILNNKQ